MARLTSLFLLSFLFLLQLGIAPTIFTECDSSNTYWFFQLNKSELARAVFAHISITVPSQPLLPHSISDPIFQQALPYLSLHFPQSDISTLLSTPLSIFLPLRLAFLLPILFLPKLLVGFFILPLTTTYSSIPGVLYGLFSYLPFKSFFLSIQLFLILLSFLSSILFYLVVFRSSHSHLRALFFTSLYSTTYAVVTYTHHLGSTIWNTTATIVFFYLISTCSSIKDLFSFTRKKQIQLAFSVLVLSSHTFSILYVAYILSLLFSLKLVRYNLLTLLRSNSLSLSIFFLNLFIFFPFNSSDRVRFWEAPLTNTHLASIQLFAHTPYQQISILDNLTSFISPILLFICLIALLINLRSLYLKPFSSSPLLYVNSIYLVICVSLVLFGFLPFSNTRHVLFLLPSLYFGLCSLCLRSLRSSFPSIAWSLSVYSISIILFVAPLFYLNKLKDPLHLSSIQIETTVNPTSQFVFDCSVHHLFNSFSDDLPYQLKQSNGFIWKDPSSHYLQQDKLLYISQSRSFTYFSDYLRKLGLDPLETKAVLSYASDIYYDPLNSGYAKPYSRPNSLFISEFILR